MIIDSIFNSSIYESVNKNFKLAFDFIKSTDLKGLEVGKHPIDGKNVFAAVSEYNQKSAEDAKWESHNNYIDIQFMITGSEVIGYSAVGNCEAKEEYNSEKDITFLHKPEQADYATIDTCKFAIYFPQDAHQPGIGNASVKKIVVKVAVN
jgi:YhcH/YjgK/YiaL family protein